MGMFDYVRCSGPEFVCAQGHDLSAEEFQTKAFDCAMAVHEIKDGLLKRSEDGVFGRGHPFPPFLGYVFVYTSCTRCAQSIRLSDKTWCEFRVRVVDDKVERVERVGSAGYDPDAGGR